MDHLCQRCVRIALYAEHPLRHIARSGRHRVFSTSIVNRADGVSSIQSATAFANELGSSEPINPPSSSDSQFSRNKSNGSAAIARPVNVTPPSGQILRRVVPRSSQPLRSDGPSQGSLLRRTASPSQPGQLLRRTGPPRQGGRPGQQGKAQGQKGKQFRRRTAESVQAREAEDIPPTEEELDEAVKRYIDPPVNPTEQIEYNPKPQDPLELQKDWPNTPLSAIGLSASVVQKIEWLARRLPHGYQTPEQIAEHFHKGNLTRFESEEEKKQVLEIATELAKKRADQLSERKGSVVAVEDMGFSDLSSKGENRALFDQVVQGQYGDLERQRMPFLDSVVRNLRNNETYHKSETDQFMATVQRLMPAQAQRRPQQQAQKKA